MSLPSSYFTVTRTIWTLLRRSRESDRMIEHPIEKRLPTYKKSGLVKTTVFIKNIFERLRSFLQLSQSPLKLYSSSLKRVGRLIE